jgi:hypothetical protein
MLENIISNITREQRLVYLYSDGNVHGGGVGVVAALALVHVVVGVDRLLAPQHTYHTVASPVLRIFSGHFATEYFDHMKR